MIRTMMVLAYGLWTILISSCSCEPRDELDSGPRGGFFYGGKEASLVRAPDLSTTGPVTISVNNEQVSVRVYGYQAPFKPESGEVNPPVFVFGDLANRALRYKQTHPEDEVVLRFAIYLIERDFFLGTVPDTPAYGGWGDYDFAADHSERLLWSLVKAAKGGVKVRFLYHNPADEAGIQSYLNEKLGNDCENLAVRRVNWVDGNKTGQQHNKFMLVSHLSAETGEVLHTTYVTSANPNFRGWGNTGVRVDGNQGLHDAYSRYFEKMFDGADKYGDPKRNQESFWSQVRLGQDALSSLPSPYSDYSHMAGNLNYDDGTFAAYFYPVPEDVPENCWSKNFNPVTREVERLAEYRGDKAEVFINMFHWRYREEGYSGVLFDRVRDATARNRLLRVVLTRDRSDRLEELLNDLSVERWHKGNFGYAIGTRSHAKDYVFRLGEGTSAYNAVITGSANAKSDAYNSKGNNQLVIRERGNRSPIADAYREVFEGFYDLYFR